MNQTEQLPQTREPQSEASAARQPYVKPVVESLGGTLTTLLASGCQCAACPPDPTADNS